MTEQTQKTFKYEDISYGEYASLDGMSHSEMRDWVYGPKKTNERRLLLGNAIHSAMEGKEKFNSEYEMCDDFDLRTSDGKKGFEDAQNKSDKTLLRQKEFQVCRGVVNSIYNDSIGKKYILSKDPKEISIVSELSYEDNIFYPEDPVKVKGRIDLMSKCTWDLKTVGWSTKDQFLDSIVSYGYDSGAALYRDLVFKLTGEYRRFFWLCVSIRPPHEVWHVEATPYMLQCGVRWIGTVMNLYQRYAKNGK